MIILATGNLSSANAFNLVQVKMLLGKELMSTGKAKGENVS